MLQNTISLMKFLDFIEWWSLWTDEYYEQTNMAHVWTHNNIEHLNVVKFEHMNIN